MEKTIEYSDDMDIREMFRLIKEEYKFTCPKCKSELTIVLKHGESTKTPLSISCPVNMNHVYDTFNYDRKKFWEGFKEEVEKLNSKQKS